MQRTVYVNASQPVELRPPLHKPRSYLFIQNLSAAAIYYAEDTQATPENGIEVGAGQYIELDLRSGGVPTGNVWLLGASVAPTQQRVLVKEE